MGPKVDNKLAKGEDSGLKVDISGQIAGISGHLVDNGLARGGHRCTGVCTSGQVYVHKRRQVGTCTGAQACTRGHTHT